MLQSSINIFLLSTYAETIPFVSVLKNYTMYCREFNIGMLGYRSTFSSNTSIKRFKYQYFGILIVVFLIIILKQNLHPVIFFFFSQLILDLEVSEVEIDQNTDIDFPSSIGYPTVLVKEFMGRI